MDPIDVIGTEKAEDGQVGFGRDGRCRKYFGVNMLSFVSLNGFLKGAIESMSLNQCENIDSLVSVLKLQDHNHYSFQKSPPKCISAQYKTDIPESKLHR